MLEWFILPATYSFFTIYLVLVYHGILPEPLYERYEWIAFIFQMIALLFGLGYLDVAVMDIKWRNMPVEVYWFAMWGIFLWLVAISLTFTYVLSRSRGHEREGIPIGLALGWTLLLFLYGAWVDHIYFLITNYNYWLKDKPLFWLRPAEWNVPWLNKQFSTLDATLFFNIPSLIALVVLWRWAIKETPIVCYRLKQLWLNAYMWLKYRKKR